MLLRNSRFDPAVLVRKRACTVRGVVEASVGGGQHAALSRDASLRAHDLERGHYHDAR